MGSMSISQFRLRPESRRRNPLNHSPEADLLFPHLPRAFVTVSQSPAISELTAVHTVRQD